MTDCIGWIKLHRQIVENELYFTERFSKMQAWIDLLLLANHKQRTIFIRGVEIQLNTGELAYSMQSLGKRWKWNKRTVKGFLNWLENRQMIHTKISNVTTIVSILKYADYQESAPQSAHQNAPQSNTRMHTDKNDKNKKKIYTSDSVEIGLSKKLLSLIKQRNPNFKQPNIQSWARHIDLMIRIDKRPPEEIEKVIRWCQQDDFWQNNILSTEKLRRQYDQLCMKAFSDNGKPVQERQRYY